MGTLHLSLFQGLGFLFSPWSAFVLCKLYLTFWEHDCRGERSPWLLNRRDHRHQSAARAVGGPRDVRRLLLLAGQESWEFTPKKVETWPQRYVLQEGPGLGWKYSSFRNRCGNHASKNSAGETMHLPFMVLPLGGTDNSTSVQAFTWSSSQAASAALERFMKYSWKNHTGFPQCSSSLNLFA